MRLVLDNKQEIHTQGHMGLVSNMPYIGPHFRVSPAAAFNDGLLDVLLFTDLSKMDLLGYAAQKVVGGGTEDPRIQHFQARRVDMDTQPAMPVMADGLEMGEGPLHITCTTARSGGDGRRVGAQPRRFLRHARMQPPDETRLPGAQNPGAWGRLILWVRLNRPFIWLVGLTAGLVLFLAWLPAYVRMFFWHGLQAQPILASMTLGFSLLALSLLWSTGQRIDAWTFLFFNVRGGHPPWLDRLMSGFTQIGNGIFIVVLAVSFFLAGDHLLAYGLSLGALTLWLVVELAKALVHRGRPFIRLSQARIVGPRAIGRSFPSGHTSQAFFMATLLAGYFHAGVWAVCLLYADRAAGGHHAHVRGGALPSGRAGGRHPGQRLGPAGGDRLRVCADQDRLGCNTSFSHDAGLSFKTHSTPENPA